MNARRMFILLFLLGVSAVHAQVPSLINYQGKLLDGTNLVNTSVGLTIRLYNDPTAGTLLYEDSNTVAVVDGLYSTFIGDNTISGSLTGALTNSAVYVEVAVNGAVLLPRERLAAVGYAIDAGDVPGNVFWRATGNTGTSESANFVGTKDNRALSFRVNNQQALRLIPDPTSPIILGGHSNNDISAVIANPGSVIAGGGRAGEVNTIAASAPYSSIGGGSGNQAGGDFYLTDHSTIAGGLSNRTRSVGTTVAGGQNNIAYSMYATVGGGIENRAEGYATTVAGGEENTASNSYAFIGGGGQNIANGRFSFAAGHYAAALHGGAFVWSDDSHLMAFESTRSNQFLIRAEGGVGINTETPATGTLTVAGSVVANVFSGSGAGLTSLNGTNLVASSVSNVVLGAASVTGDKIKDGTISNADVAANTFWTTAGNTGTTAGAHFLGTTDSRPLELRVNNAKVMTISTSALPNIVLGSSDNVISPQVRGASIGGGFGNSASGIAACVAGGSDNRIDANGGAIGGGSNNTIDSSGTLGAVGGGMLNTVDGYIGVIAGGYSNTIDSGATYGFVGAGIGNNTKSDYDVIGGGANNHMDTLANYSVIAGGQRNTMTNFSHGSFIGSGYDNSVSGRWAVVGGGWHNEAGEDFATVGGGSNNFAGGAYSTVPGGDHNAATGNYSFAAGRRAKAKHDGAFVWADSQNADFSSTTNDQFAIRASNGVWIAENAGGIRDVEFGERYRDNGIIAWARIAADGSWSSDSKFNVTNVAYNGEGNYRVYIGDSAANLLALLPVAVAEVDNPPSNSASLRIVSVNQIGVNYFDVWINNGSGNATNNDFVFMVTGR